MILFKNQTMVDEWKSAYKWASVRLAVLAGMIATYIATYPDQFAQIVEHLPTWAKPLVPIVTVALPIYLRLTQKDSTKA